MENVKVTSMLHDGSFKNILSGVGEIFHSSSKAVFLSYDTQVIWNKNLEIYDENSSSSSKTWDSHDKFYNFHC